MCSVLHRYPTITKDAEPWELDMWKVQEKILDKRREVLNSTSLSI